MFDVQLRNKKIIVEQCENFVNSPDCGAVVTFSGKVRNHTNSRRVVRLEFEAYEKMARSEMEKICIESLEKFEIRKMSMHHRTGKLKIGDMAVAISCASPHRKAAFRACEFAIETLKKTVPIWKKEIYEDGEVWVSAHP